MEKQVKFYQASTSEMYGLVRETLQNESTPFYPRSPYACAKVYSYWVTVNYREAYGLFACNGILFNHESPIRGETFITRKITLALSRIALGLQDTLYLGNLEAKRDWGHAKDYVEMMWRMLQQEEPEDYVVATGEHHSVREFATRTARELGIDLRWEGQGVDEVGVVDSLDENRFNSLCSSLNGNGVAHFSSQLQPGDVLVRVDPRYFRPTEVETLLGDPSKAKNKLGWEPQTSFNELVREMVAHDLEQAQRDELCKRAGFRVMDYNE